MKEKIVSNKSQKDSHQLLPRNKSHFFNSDFRLRKERQIAKLLKTQNKQLLRMTLSFRTYSESRKKALLKLCDQFPKNLCFLKQLSFGDGYFTKLPIKNVLRTSKYLQTARSLTHFEILGSTLNQVATLAPFIKGLKRLERISLDLCDFAQNHFIFRLFFSLRSLKELKSIRICAKTGEIVPAGTLRKLSTGLSRLKTVESIHLDLNGLRFDAKQDFFFDFRALKSLSSITFNMKNRHGVNDKVLADIARSIEKIAKLEKLEMNLHYCQQITSKSVKILSSSLPCGLKSLNLDFRFCEQVREKGIQSLFCSIQKMTFLEDLSLWFSEENAITNQGLLDLNLCLSGLKWLKSLEISVMNRNFKFDYLVFDEFLSVLTFKTPLKKLVLQFPVWGHSMINDKRLESLGNTLMNLNRIETLELNSCMRYFGEDAIYNFSNKLLAFKKLQVLNLDFSQSDLKNAKVVERFIKNLEKLKDLRKATLNFQYCHSLETLEVEKIIPNPKSLKFELLVLYEKTMYIS